MVRVINETPGRMVSGILSTRVNIEMAKSLRSKKERKNRAIKREQVYQPVEDARIARVVASHGPVDSVLADSTISPQTNTLVEKRRRNRRRHQSTLPSAYGLSMK